MAAKDIPDDLLQAVRDFLARKYVARGDERQRSMGLYYIEAERDDLAREVATFVMQWERRLRE